MFDILFPIYALGVYGEDPEYYNLTEEEKANLDFVDSYLNNEDKRISDAAFYIMLLVIEISNEPDKYEPEDIGARLDEIRKDLSKEEIIMMDKYMLACINSMGIYSEERKKERLLKRKEMNNNE